VTHGTHQPGEPEAGHRDVAKHEVEGVDLARAPRQKSIVDDRAPFVDTRGQAADGRTPDGVDAKLDFRVAALLPDPFQQTRSANIEVRSDFYLSYFYFLLHYSLFIIHYSLFKSG
jgi:hypothetical protein